MNRWRWSVLVALAIGGCGGDGEHERSAPPTAASSATTSTIAPTTTTSAPRTTGRPLPTTTVATVDSDFDRWLLALDETHPQAFHAVTRDEFVTALDQLRAELPDLSPAAASVAVMRVAGMLSRERDGHQVALPQPDAEWPVLPFQLYELPEGLVITSARPPYEDLVGARIDAIGPTAVADALAAVEPLVPRDGPATVPTFRPGLVLRTVVLRGLGVIPDVDGPVELTVTDTSGALRTVAVDPVALDEHVAWAGQFGVVRLPARAEPAYLDRLDVTERYELRPDGTLYLRLTEIRGAREVALALRDLAPMDHVVRVALDLRQNPGGDNSNNRAVVERFEALATLRPDLPLVVLTDRVTFSAASNLATELEQRTDAVFVGEAMGGGLNFWDDVRFVELDALPVPMQVGVSTRYWEMSTPDDPRLTIEPDIPVTVTAADLFAGRDPALDAALAVG